MDCTLRHHKEKPIPEGNGIAIGSVPDPIHLSSRGAVRNHGVNNDKFYVGSFDYPCKK